MSLLPSSLLISVGSGALPVLGSGSPVSISISEFLSLSPLVFQPGFVCVCRGVSLALCLSVSALLTSSPSPHLRLDRSVSCLSHGLCSSSLNPAGSRSLSPPARCGGRAGLSGAGRSGGRGPGGVRARGGGWGAFLRQSHPGGGGAGAAAARLPLGAFKGAGGSGEAAAAAVAAAERAGRGRGARRSESARAGGGSAPGPGQRTARSGAAQREPAARDMAKAGRAGEGERAPGGQGPRTRGGTRLARGGAGGPGEPRTQVGGGSGRVAAGSGEARPPERAEGAPRAPRPSCAPGHLVGHPVPLAMAPLAGTRAAAPLFSPAVGAHHPPEACPGMGTVGLSRGCHFIPRPPTQTRTRPLVLPLALSRTRHRSPYPLYPRPQLI